MAAGRDPRSESYRPDTRLRGTEVRGSTGLVGRLHHSCSRRAFAARAPNMYTAVNRLLSNQHSNHPQAPLDRASSTGRSQRSPVGGVHYPATRRCIATIRGGLAHPIAADRQSTGSPGSNGAAQRPDHCPRAGECSKPACSVSGTADACFSFVVSPHDEPMQEIARKPQKPRKRCRHGSLVIRRRMGGASRSVALRIGVRRRRGLLRSLPFRAFRGCRMREPRRWAGWSVGWPAAL